MYDPKEMLDTRYSDKEIQKNIKLAQDYLSNCPGWFKTAASKLQLAQTMIQYNRMIEKRFELYLRVDHIGDILPDAYDQERKIPNADS
jgi:hypothetical protein